MPRARLAISADFFEKSFRGLGAPGLQYRRRPLLLHCGRQIHPSCFIIES
ncbi:hypothetical protein AGRO_4244 [Agrobacterium sp. ATCC 31749]|nr:hypothetical protein AGRO_4244 [Agrobacterium sp. ATCC 31749]